MVQTVGQPARQSLPFRARGSVRYLLTHIPILNNMATHMKTTIDINDELFRSARQLADDTGTTFRALVEEGLRHMVERRREEAPRPPFSLQVFNPPGDMGLAPPYDKLGLHQAILDSYPDVDYSERTLGAVHDRD